MMALFGTTANGTKHHQALVLALSMIQISHIGILQWCSTQITQEYVVWSQNVRLSLSIILILIKTLFKACAPGWFHHRGKCFRYSVARTDWETHETFCNKNYVRKLNYYFSKKCPHLV